jgi:hypothetical protein
LAVHLDLDRFPGLADLDLPVDPLHRHRVTIRVHRHVALDVDVAMMDQAGLREMEWQRTQATLFQSVELDRLGLQVTLVGPIDPVAP